MTSSTRRVVAGLVAAGFLFSPPVRRHVSDAQLLAYVASSYDKREMAFQTIVLGDHNGVVVVADFPCADVCPAYTTRVIHYDLDPGPGCEAQGGVNESIIVPVGIAAFPVPFCVPTVLVGVTGHPGYLRR